VEAARGLDLGKELRSADLGPRNLNLDVQDAPVPRIPAALTRNTYNVGEKARVGHGTFHPNEPAASPAFHLTVGPLRPWSRLRRLVDLAQLARCSGGRESGDKLAIPPGTADVGRQPGCQMTA